MFSEFSRGYYVGRLFVAPGEDEHARLHRAAHEQVNEQLYVEDADLARLDAPLVMKVRNRHLAVHGGADVPEATLEVPGRVLDDAGIRNPPSREEVLLAKADVAGQLLRLSGGGDGPPGGPASGGDGPAGI